MGYGHDLNFKRQIAEDNRKGITIKHPSPRPMKVGRKQSWPPTNLFDGRKEFFV